MRYELIEREVAVAPDGHVHSIYGAILPGSKIVKKGYTILDIKNGTTSNQPILKVKTREEAQRIVDNMNKNI